MYSVPFGVGHLEFELLPGMRGTLVESKDVPPLASPASAIQRALADPVGSAPLRDLAKPGDRVCLVFTDVTRACPDTLLVPPLLAELQSAGVRDEDITLLCGTGLHRPTTTAEKIGKLGLPVVNRYRVVDNAAQDEAAVVHLGATDPGVPVWVNRLVAEADLVLATGVVEPHQYAGYSGGRKTVAVGAAGEATIAYTHGIQMADHPGARLGRVEGNPFHEALSEAARRAGLRFILNVVLDDHERIIAVRAGEPIQTFLELVTAAREVYEAPVPQQYDVAVAGLGHPKDANLYQASRAASYLFLAPVPVVRRGGCIILPAPCPEGAGQGAGERRFYDMMRSAPDAPSLLANLRRTGYPAGAQRAFFLAQVLAENSVIVVGAQHPDLVRQLHMIPADTMMEALHCAIRQIGRSDLDVLIVPRALHTLPIVQFEPLHVAVGTVRLQMRRSGDDPQAVDAHDALRILEALSRTEPELAASRWYASAQPHHLQQFLQMWESRSGGD